MSQVTVEPLTTYTPELADQIRNLLIELSRNHHDKGEIPESWFEDIIASPWHDLLLAKQDDKILGMACLSVLMGPGIHKNAYLEDFVTSKEARGQGVGSALWQAMLEWSAKKGCKRLEFTCGPGRETARLFYESHGATVYDTNFYRKELKK